MDSWCAGGMAAGSDTECDGRDWQVSPGVTQWLLTCHLSCKSFHQNWSMEASEWPVELSAGILCHILNSVALRQLPSPPCPLSATSGLAPGNVGAERFGWVGCHLEGLAARVV